MTRKIHLLLALLSTTMTVVVFAYYLQYDINIIRNFSKDNEAYSYIEAVRSGKINVEEIKKLFTDNIAVMSYTETRDMIKSPIRIEYYENENDKLPVYVIEKGEMLQIESFSQIKSELEFYGNISLPTEKREWRLARPFITGGEETDKFLYVRLEDLVCVTNEWLKENNEFFESLSQEAKRRGILPTTSNISKELLLIIDCKLYDCGMFLSKDLIKPVLNRMTLICLFITIALWGRYSYYFKYNPKKEKIP